MLKKIIPILKQRLIKNIIWSLLGTVTPLMVAIVSIPLLIEGMGVAKFGILTLAWMVVGYFSLFDLGLGRALTKVVAEKIGANKKVEIPLLVWTGMSLMLFLGLIGAGFVVSISPWLVYHSLNIPKGLQPETLDAFYWLAISIPIVISSTGLRGILEAHQEFAIINVIRLPLGILTFAGPLIVLSFSNSLSHMVIVLVCSRAISWLAYLLVVAKKYPELLQKVTPKYKVTKLLLSFGGWMTVSNITAPLLLYLGRIVIMILLSAEAVAYFSTPYEVVIRLLIIPGIIVSVLFPEFAKLFQKKNHNIRILYNKVIKYLFVIMLPITGIIFYFAKDGLAYWINIEFATHGYIVAQILAIGVFINSFGHISQAIIQGYGRPDITAKLHLFELLLYIPYLWFLINSFGINGAALAWAIRVTISTLLLHYLASRCITGSLVSKY